jgi:heme-degrading monooxygenase HmoA
MYAVIFSAETNELDQSYSDTAARMRELAKNKYGCIAITSVTERNQEITISYWGTQEQITAWKQDPEHLQAQELGRSKWYKSYHVQIVKVEREYDYNMLRPLR